MKDFLCRVYHHSTGIRGLGLCAVYFLIICAIYYFQQFFDSLLVYSFVSSVWQNVTGQHLFLDTFYDWWFGLCLLFDFVALFSPALILLLWARADKQSSLRLRQYHTFVALLSMFLGYIYIYHLAAPLTRLVNEKYDPVRYWLEGGSNEDLLSAHDVVGHQNRDAREKADLISAGSEASDLLIKVALNGQDQATLEQCKKRAERLYVLQQFSNVDYGLRTPKPAKTDESSLKFEVKSNEQGSQSPNNSEKFHNHAYPLLGLTHQDFIDETVKEYTLLYRYNAIHALALIGDDTALAALKSLAQSNDKLMSADALLALRNLDPVFYATTHQRLQDEYLATHPVKP